MKKTLSLLFIVIAFNITSKAQTQEPKTPQIDFQEMMQQMEEMMKSFPIDSFYFKGMDDMKKQFGNIDLDTLGGHMESIMAKMQEIFTDIDFSSIEEEFKQMEAEMRKQLPKDEDSNPKKESDSNVKKRKVTKL